MERLGQDAWVVLPPLLIALGIVGIVVPVLPGLLLVVAGLGVWALATQSVVGWVVLVLGLLVAGTGAVLQYLVPGRRMRERGVATSTIVVAVLLAVVGFFLVPVIGAVVGFVGGIWLVETGRGSGRQESWARTRHAVLAILQGWGIEMAAALVVAGLYVVGVLLS
ncbi:DUF456 domain-containing protein [Phycicoccus flavus]|uniref:DUF456 domain-containing protein n=1 Tax=Phycicoccus flavus TaxID=2502783 RepID=UPI000FEBF72B|nr:DUF456 domain-containing protein [Phycicoccus flavus]NHA67041.1 DUF456 domain-containing protein [Phycicoccus flavus]NHA69603.1 DUF456 domain-containing protein [Phycicoccus flavus]